MNHSDPITDFYQKQLPEAERNNNILTAPCPFCLHNGREQQGTLIVFLNPESYFHGYYRCSNRCSPGGFQLHFARQLKICLQQVPGFDPDRDYNASKVDYPIKNLNNELLDFRSRMTSELKEQFTDSGIKEEVLDEMQIGYNGRYLVYPYFQEDGNCYAARCVHPNTPEDSFWYGNEDFFTEKFHIFNIEDISHCENGSLFLVEGENNLLTLRQLGLPAIALPTAAEFISLKSSRLSWIKNIFICVNNTPESQAAAKDIATRFGYKVRIINWPQTAPKKYSLVQMAQESGKNFHKQVFTLLQQAKSVSPFGSPEGEYLHFQEQLQLESGDSYKTMQSGFSRLDKALGGVHGITIMGGLPKAGKSSFFIQIATEMAQKKVPVIYYDFENGRQKIYQRTLCRLSRLPSEQIKKQALTQEELVRLDNAHGTLKNILPWFRVVTDRKLDPDIMRSHIDFLRHETNSEYTLVVIDSLHKLPFKDFSKRRTGIDAWLRQLEAIRDELGVSFLVISELTRGEDGQYDSQPQLGAFKGSGDIEYSADNAMVLMPQWDPFGNSLEKERYNDLWLVASREHSPGKIASYLLDYPYWGFTEKKVSEVEP
jgi:replicative DNA helicase